MAGPFFKQTIDDEAAGCGIEIAGGLVGEQQLGAGNKRAGNRDALLFTARELRRIMAETLREPNRTETLRRCCERVATATQLQWQCDVLERGHRRDQMKRLKHNPDAIAAQTRQPILVEAPEVLRVDPYSAGGRSFEPAEHHQQARFPRARGTDQSNGFASLDLKRDTAQDVDGPSRAAQS
jgi:hypothetical protein